MRYWIEYELGLFLFPSHGTSAEWTAFGMRIDSLLIVVHNRGGSDCEASWVECVAFSLGIWHSGGEVMWPFCADRNNLLIRCLSVRAFRAVFIICICSRVGELVLGKSDRSVESHCSPLLWGFLSRIWYHLNVRVYKHAPQETSWFSVCAVVVVTWTINLL